MTGGLPKPPHSFQTTNVAMGMGDPEGTKTPVAGYGGHANSFPTHVEKPVVDLAETTRGAIREQFGGGGRKPVDDGTDAGAAAAESGLERVRRARLATQGRTTAKQQAAPATSTPLPWPSDRPPAEAMRANGLHARPHASELKTVDPPRVGIPPGYSATIAKLNTSSQSVGKTYGAATEQRIGKRVAKGETTAIHLQPVRYGENGVPHDPTYYDSLRGMPVGREEDKEALQKTFGGKTYRTGTTRELDLPPPFTATQELPKPTFTRS